MFIAGASYFFVEGLRNHWENIAQLREQAGYLFSFCGSVFAAALLPEAFRIFYFQRGRVLRENFSNLLFAIPFWGSMGMMVDFFYRCQSEWFGNSNDWKTVASKMAVDMLVYSPLFSSPVTVTVFAWRDGLFRSGLRGRELFWKLFHDRYLPTQVASWCVWGLVIVVVYSMPPALQIPIQQLAQCFWVLIFTTLNVQKPSVPRRRETEAS